MGTLADKLMMCSGGGIVLPTTIGDEFQGGYYMGQLGGYYLICAPIAGQGSTLQWKTANTTTAGTTSLTDGYANTAAMVTAGISLHPAGKFCVDLTIGEFSDWYLPSKDELNLLYTNHAALEAAGSGSFIDNYYWSSSEHIAGLAWEQTFDDGEPGYTGKVTNYYVRAISRYSA